MTGDDVPQAGAPHHVGRSDDGTGVEDLLAGRRRPETEDDMALDRLLSALRAPGTADELSGLEATTAAFVAARSEADGSAVVVPFPGRSRRRAVTVGVTAAALLATLGVASAAAYTGNLPRGLQQLASETIGAPAPAPDPSESGEPSTSAAGSGSSSAGSATPQGPNVSPSAPALAGLCQAFADRGASFASEDSTAYAVLEAAAVAKGLSVADYCAASAPSRGPSVTPSAKPTAKPSPSSKPTAKPSPTRKPTQDPSGGAPTARTSTSSRR